MEPASARSPPPPWTYAADPSAGSFDGSNVTALVIDGEEAFASVTVGQGGTRALIGCFNALPDVDQGQLWPEPAAWAGCTGLTDSSGDAIFYLVAAPGSSGRNLWGTVQIGATTRPWNVRIVGLSLLSASSN